MIYSNNIYRIFVLVLFFLLMGKEPSRAEDKEKTSKQDKEYTKHNNVGLIHYRMGNYDESIKSFKEVIRIAPRSSSAYFNLSMAYYKKKDYVNSDVILKKVLKLRPDHKNAQKLQKIVQKAIDLILLPPFLKIPVIFYDYKKKGNPNFNAKNVRMGKITSIKNNILTHVTKTTTNFQTKPHYHKKQYKITKDTRVYGINGKPNKIIKPSKFTDNKNRKFQTHPTRKNEIIALMAPDVLYPKTGLSEIIQDKLSRDRKPILKKYEATAQNFLFNQWFRPNGSDDSKPEFYFDKDYNRWRWKGVEQFNNRDDEFVIKGFNENDWMANVVIYDHIKLKLEKLKSDDILKDLKNEIRQIEKSRELRIKDRIKKNADENHLANQAAIFDKKKATIEKKMKKLEKETKVVYKFDKEDFFPIQGKGFSFAKKTEKNKFFSMEMHTDILYRGGEYFDFRAKNHLWIFINGKLVLEIFDTTRKSARRLELDKIKGLKKGKQYPFDLFYVNQKFDGSLRMDGTFRFNLPEPPKVELALDKKTFIPGEDKINIKIQCKRKAHRKWVIKIMDEKKKIIKTFSGQKNLPDKITWDGTDIHKNDVEPGKQFKMIMTGINEVGIKWESNEARTMSEIRIDVGAEIILYTIKFDPFSAELKEESKKAIDRVFMLLYNNPNVKIMAKGHVAAYSKWTREQLIELSMNRAESVRQYLIDSGIDPERIQAQGFGDTQPISKSQTSEAPAFNRRTEFEIIEK